MPIIEDFWPRVVGTIMWALFTLAGVLLVVLQGLIFATLLFILYRFAT
jgi:hypothetical protein